MTPEARAAEANAVLNNSVFIEALDDIEKQAIEDMIEGGDINRRRNADTVKAIRQLRQTLQRWAIPPAKIRQVV